MPETGTVGGAGRWCLLHLYRLTSSPGYALQRIVTAVCLQISEVHVSESLFPGMIVRQP